MRRIYKLTVFRAIIFLNIVYIFPFIFISLSLSVSLNHH